MVDDSSNRSSGSDEGSQPSGDAASKIHRAARLDSDAILGLLEARLELSASSATELVRSGGVPTSSGRDSASDNAEGTSLREPMEMTPTPMVVASATEGTPAVPQARYLGVQAALERAKRSAATTPRDGLVWREPIPRARIADDGEGGGEGTAAMAPPFSRENAEVSLPGQPEYYPPRQPPTSIAPPPVTSSFSVAPQYDPKAPTRPKARRNTSLPPPPLLFGLDRMLVWGLVLGGLFVAVIVVIVHQLALSSSQRPEHAVIVRDEGTLANENKQPQSQLIESAQGVDEASEAARTAAIGAKEAAEREHGSVIGPEHSGDRLGSDDAGVLSNSAVTRDSTNVESVQSSEKAKLPGIGGGKGAPTSLPHPNRAGAVPRKSWIE